MIADNPTNGVIGFEYPNPFTAENGFEGTIFFQLAGNRISSNVFVHNGSRGGAFTGDVTLAGGFSEIFGHPESHSVNNCVSGNASDQRHLPGEHRRNLGLSEQNHAESRAVVLRAVEYLVGLQLEAAAIREAVPPVGQPAPPPQPTMTNPCTGVPKNPLCP